MTSGTSSPHCADPGNAVRFVLPGPLPVRETLAGWEQWRAARGSFVPAPRLDLAAWRALPPRRRMLYDLHRAATHANLPLQQTPMSQAVTRVLRGRIESNALKHKPSTRAGVMITGGGYQGKTETACEVAADFEDAWLDLHHHLNPAAVPGTRDLHAPVAYVQTPVTAKPKSTCKAILGFYGADTKNMDLPDLVRQVAASLSDHGTKALLLDDITRLRMHRADDQDVLDLIRAFMSMHVTLVLIGVDIPGSGLLREGRHDPRTSQWLFPPSRHAGVHGLEATQTERRFDLIELDRFRYDTPAQITAWTQHLAGIEQQLRLMDAAPGMLTGGTMPEYLYRRTNGVVGLLERLIEDGCREAIDTGTEHLDQALLDNVALSLPDAGNRDAEAGEIPPIPPGPARPGATDSGTRKRGRNTAFDDRGTASGAGALPCAEQPMTSPGPLPRSLEPLPEECLPGYVLRLAHRLGLAPARILQLTGLTVGTTAPRGLMLHLDAAAAAAFAGATRLTSAEITSLRMSSMSGRYPPAAPVITTSQQGTRPVTSPWVFTTATRYCPQCLAGDGSPIQGQHGGAWRKTWRLPVVFACPVHHRLLEHLCPSCGQPAMSAPASLIPYSRISGLHPVQCRAALSTSRGGSPILCAARLDLRPHPAAAGRLPGADLDMLLAVQDRLLDLLRPDGPTVPQSVGRPATPAQYFADLRLTSGLISAAWPASRPLFPSRVLADAFSEHAAANRTGHRDYRIYDTPPRDALACAALVTAAAGILDSPDLRLLGPHLTPARDADSTSKDSPRWRWIRRYRRTRHECSAGFQDALEPLLPTFRRAGQHRHGRRAPARDIAFGPEHIPEHLQDNWFRQHFRHIDRISPRLLRRAAAARLVQMTAGGSLAEAAAYLGIDHRYIAASPGTAFAAAAYWTPGTGPAEFHLAVHALARQLSATADLINYKHRRDALQNWCIDPATWQDIISQLPRTKGPFQPELSDCKRQFASEAVWARVTQGEHVLAPRIIENPAASGDPTWHRRRGNMWHFYLANPSKPHYAALKEILNAYADNLAAAIDRAAVATERLLRSADYAPSPTTGAPEVRIAPSALPSTW